MTTGEKVMAVLTALSALAAFWAIRESKASTKLAEKAHTTSQSANDLAREANKLGQTANSYAKEANMISQRMFDAENMTHLEIELRPVVHYDAREISPDDPRQGVDVVLSVKIRNLGKIPITVSNVLLVNAEKEVFRAVPRVQAGKATQFPKLPHDIEPWQSLEIEVARETLAWVLDYIGVQQGLGFFARVIDSVDRKYDSDPVIRTRLDLSLKHYIQIHRTQMAFDIDDANQPPKSGKSIA